jgi:hypothetical protein
MLMNEEHLRQSSDPVRRPAVPCAPARTLARFDRERENRPFVLNSLRTLFLAPIPQTSPFHQVEGSFAEAKNITPAFPSTSTLLLRSFVKERKSTPFFSIACALFCRKWGWRANLVTKLDYRDNDFGVPTILARTEGQRLP